VCVNGCFWFRKNVILYIYFELLYFCSYIYIYICHRTLLDLIARRKLAGTWSGDIYLNDDRNELLQKHDIAYVLQDDIHISTLTVEETLLYAAWTKLPEEYTHAQRYQRVDEVISIMGLQSVRRNVVGDILSKGISGESFIISSLHRVYFVLYYQ